MHSRQNRSTSPLLALHARQMRFAPTDSEERLWFGIRGKRLGTAFRRQVPIGRFIVDFLALGPRLIVEVDGGYHARRSTADARRDEALRRLGYHVLRLESELVMQDLPGAVARIAAELEALSGR